jgi:hypothetical protein
MIARGLRSYGVSVDEGTCSRERGFKEPGFIRSHRGRVDVNIKVRFKIAMHPENDG